MIEDIDRSWRRLELRHLVALEAVAAQGSFRRAAQALGYTQSAVSAQLAALEQIVGQQLVERPRRGRALQLTEAGEAVLVHGEQIGARIGALRADLESMRRRRVVLRVGVYQSVAATVLPPLLRELSTAEPGLDVRLEEAGDDGVLLGLLERGDLDLAFAALPLEPGPFSAHELFAEPYRLLVPSDAPYASVESMPLRELDRLPLIDYRSVRSVHLTRTKLRAAGGSPHVAFRSDDNGTIHALVAAGVGVAVLPASSIDPSAHGVRAVSLDPPLPMRRLALVHHRDRAPAPAAGAFLEAARVVAAAIAPTA